MSALKDAIFCQIVVSAWQYDDAYLVTGNARQRSFLAVYSQYIYNINMAAMENIDFEWDARKEQSNRQKHEISFKEARTVFADPYARIIDDPDHSDEEDRFVIIGLSLKANVLTVCHCYRRSGNVIRIISARKATKNETKIYWRYYHEN